MTASQPAAGIGTPAMSPSATDLPAGAAGSGLPVPPATPATPDAPKRSGWWHVGRWGRRALLVALIGGAAYTLTQDHPRRCHDEVSDGAQVVSVCEPIATTSPEAFVWIVAVGLLLLPELSELEIAGVLKLKRQVEQAQGEAAEARIEAAHAQLAAAQLATQVATQQTNVTANNQQALTLTIQTAEAQRILAGTDQPPARISTPTVGQSALVAFNAGMLGLEQLIEPPPGSQVAVVGFTVAEDGSLEAIHNPYGVKDAMLDRAAGLLNDPGLQPSEVLSAIAPDGWVVATLALTTPGELIGGLAVVLQPTPAFEDITDEPLGPVGAQLRVAAGAYGQLLVGLLGEQPAPNSAL